MLFSLNLHKNSPRELVVSPLQRKLRLRKIHSFKRNGWCWNSNQKLLASRAVSMTLGHLPNPATASASLCVPYFSQFLNVHQKTGAGPC